MSVYFQRLAQRTGLGPGSEPDAAAPGGVSPLEVEIERELAARAQTSAADTQAPAAVAAAPAAPRARAPGAPATDRPADALVMARPLAAPALDRPAPPAARGNAASPGREVTASQAAASVQSTAPIAWRDRAAPAPAAASVSAPAGRARIEWLPSPHPGNAAAGDPPESAALGSPQHPPDIAAAAPARPSSSPSRGPRHAGTPAQLRARGGDPTHRVPDLARDPSPPSATAVPWPWPGRALSEPSLHIGSVYVEVHAPPPPAPPQAPPPLRPSSPRTVRDARREPPALRRFYLRGG
jgi:hypothetical protein